MVKVVKVGDLSDFPPGTLHGRDVEGRHLIIVNLEGDIRALDGVCTHEYAELDKGFLLGDRVMCPLHLSQFDLRTGEVLNPPAEESLAPYRVEIRDSTVYVEVN
jgi:3-phenylpropionate/trans-cinnamate dioxygenase ferredoxin subunit